MIQNVKGNIVVELTERMILSFKEDLILQIGLTVQLGVHIYG